MKNDRGNLKHGGKLQKPNNSIATQLLRLFVRHYDNDIEMGVPYTLEKILSRTLSLPNAPQLATPNLKDYKEAIWKIVAPIGIQLENFFITKSTGFSKPCFYFKRTAVNEHDPCSQIQEFLRELWREADKEGMFERTLVAVDLAQLARDKGIKYNGQNVNSYTINSMFIILQLNNQPAVLGRYNEKFERLPDPQIVFFE